LRDIGSGFAIKLGQAKNVYKRQKSSAGRGFDICVALRFFLREKESAEEMVKYKTFVSRSFFGRPSKQKQDRVRWKALSFIRTQVGSENVISVAESRTSWGHLSVTVWYREKDEPLKRMQLTAEEKQSLGRKIAGG
jgi:hypothetical protein